MDDQLATNHQILLCYILDTLCINCEMLCLIILDDLCMRKQHACVVPKSQTAEQKQRWLDVCNNSIGQCIDNENLLDRVVTGDESRFFNYDPSDKRASRVYMKAGEPNLKTPCQSRSHIKSKLILFFSTYVLSHNTNFLGVLKVPKESRGPDI